MPIGQARSRRRHEVILEAALGVFSRKGYREAAVDDIAAEAATSKGGVYFHFPSKQAIFLALLDRTAALLRGKVEAAVAAETEPLARADAALGVVLDTFASHRTLARLFFVEGLGAGHELHERMAALRAEFAELIRRHLEDAVRAGRVPPIDAGVAAQVWFGALNEVLTRWALSERPQPLEGVFPTVRAMLLRSIGAPEAALERPGGASDPMAAPVDATMIGPGDLPRIASSEGRPESVLNLAGEEMLS